MVALVLAAVGECPLLDQLRAQAEARHLLSLARLVRRAPPPTVHEFAPRASCPSQTTAPVASSPSASGKALARSPNRPRLRQAVERSAPARDPSALGKSAAHRRRRGAPDGAPPGALEVLEALAQHSRWLTRARVRLSLLFNPGTPPAIAMPLLAVCTRNELSEGLAAH